MDWGTIITSIISAIVTGGGISSIIFFRENKRSKFLSNEAAASAQWKDLYEKSEAKVDSQSHKIDSLYREKDVLRDQINDLTSQIAVLELLKCETMECITRKPPMQTKTNK